MKLKNIEDQLAVLGLKFSDCLKKSRKTFCIL